MSQLQAEHGVAEPAPGVTRAPGHRRAALAALVLLLLVGVASALQLRAPAPVPSSAPAGEFSADRAVALLDGIASVPHPTGSAASATVRAYLVGELRGLGLEPRTETRVATRASGSGRATVGTVTNIHAVLPGSRPGGGRVLLVTHYDSVPTGPGAADSGSNVATVIEVARALLAGPRPANDVEVLFTDGEEQGLLGAQAFVDSGVAGDPRRVVALNLEARGNSGPAVMFQVTGEGLAPAVRAAGAVTTSLADAVYQVLPNDTDLTALRAGGIRGLNFAFIGGAASYHTPHDDIAHLDHRSVQSMGDAVLAAARHLAAAEIPQRAPEATYFSLFGAVVAYPQWLTLPLAALAVAGYVLLLWVGRRRGLRPGGAGRAAAGLAVVVPGAAIAGFGGWWLLTVARPDFLVALAGIHRPGRYALAEALLLLVLLVAWYRWARRRATAAEVALAVLGWFVVLGLVLALLLPGGAYLFTWPALIGVAAHLAALRFAAPGSPVRTLAPFAGALPAVALMTPVGLLLLPALGPGLTVVPLLLGALLAALLIPAIEPLPRRRTLTTAMAVLAVACVAIAGAGVATDSYDRTRPQPVSLAYVLETDTGTATWVSAGGPGQPGIGRLVTAGPVRLDERVPPFLGWSLHAGPAPVVANLARPEVTGSPSAESGVRTLRVTAPAGAYRVDVYADTSAHEILGATVDGATIAGGLTVPAEAAPWRWGFRYTAPPADGIDLTLRVRGAGPLPVRVVSTSATLPAAAGAPALPPEASWSGWPVLAGETLVVRTFRL
ncbi:M20/M25/M40 family metallo-hydrolase [Micromonospora sp. KLBMP9576]|uniref:M20/M25/M40 family metallo-hydrolase n=1 Tax=Micromonospora sp. KLBMP9576 TaxID=3424769 RepID=UPI003D8F0AEC